MTLRWVGLKGRILRDSHGDIPVRQYVSKNRPTSGAHPLLLAYFFVPTPLNCIKKYVIILTVKGELYDQFQSEP